MTFVHATGPGALAACAGQAAGALRPATSEHAPQEQQPASRDQDDRQVVGPEEERLAGQADHALEEEPERDEQPEPDTELAKALASDVGMPRTKP